MILNRSHLPWVIFVVVVSAISSVLYLANFHPETLPFNVHLPKQFGEAPPIRDTVGGTPLGLFFGTASLLIFLFASALGVRKKRRTWPLGNVQSWLRAHIWLTVLTVPFVAFHCGFKIGGPMTSWVIALYTIVMVSGFLGLALQQCMPRLMTQRLPREVVYEQIPYVRELLVESADQLWQELAPTAPSARKPVAVAHGKLVPAGLAPESELGSFAAQEDGSPHAIAEFLHDDCLPYLRLRNGRSHRLASPKAAEDLFRLLRLNVTERWREQVDLMQQWCDDRRALDAQSRLHHWLHGWLLVHVPISFALLVLTFWHAYVTLIYLQAPKPVSRHVPAAVQQYATL